VRHDLLRDFVAFEHVLQRRDLETELVGDAQEHEDLVGAIGMRVHQPLAFENLDERLELQIPPRRDDLFARLLAPIVVLPVLLVCLGADERVADDVLDAHARAGIAGRRSSRRAGAAAAALGIFAERELDARHRALEDEVLRTGLAPAQFDHLILAANRVGAAVEHVRDRQAAGEVAVDVDVGRREHVLDPGHRAHRRAPFVDRVGGDVRVAVDDARRDELAGGVDDLGAGGNGDVRADCRHLAVAQDDRSVLNRPLGDGENRSAANGDDRGRSRLSGETAERSHGEQTRHRDKSGAGLQPCESQA
jgi:hypothetical protein